MTKTNMTAIVLIIISAVIAAIGQLLIKGGLSELGEIKILDINAVFYWGYRIITNKFILYGLMCSAIAAFLGFVALSRVELSVFSPISLGLFLIVIAIFSALILKEPITFNKILGVFTILIGIIILSAYRH